MAISKLLIAVGLALAASTVSADPQWSEAEEAALQALLASKASRERRAPTQPEINTENGDVTIIAGTDGEHIAYEIDGIRTNIDEIPAAARDFAAATAGTLQVGYNMGKTTKTVTDTCDRLLTKMEDSVDGDIATLKDDVKTVKVNGETLKGSLASVQADVNTKIGETQKELNSQLDTKVKDLEASVDNKLKSTSEYVAKAKACGATGQGVTVIDGKLACSDVTPTADKDAKCDDKNEGKISVRPIKVGDFTYNTVNVCVKTTWHVLSRVIPKEVMEYGKTAGKKGKSCRDILKINPTAESGKYFVTQHNNAIYPVYCEMDSAYKGGGWQLLLTLTHPHRMFGGSRHPLGYTNINANAPSVTDKYARNWNGVNKPQVNDEFLIRESAGGRWKTFKMTHAHCGWSSRSSGVCNGCHGTYAKGQIYNEDGSSVPCGGAGCWLNSCSVCGGCNSNGCDTIGFNADHGDYNARYGGSQWQSFGSGWNAPMDGANCGGAWGKKQKNDVFPLNLFYRSAKK